jgi:anaerobic selenocysteine-containing dehydrogenase
VRCRTAFDHFLKAAQAFTLEEVAARWVEKSKIESVADAIASAKSIAYYTWTGLGQHAESTQIDRAFATLMALKGSFDAPGGNVILPAQKRNAVCGPSFLSRGQLAKAIGLEEKPLGPPNQGRITAHGFYAAAIEGKPYRVIPKAPQTDSQGDSRIAVMLIQGGVEDSRHAISGQIARGLFGRGASGFGPAVEDR